MRASVQEHDRPLGSSLDVGLHTFKVEPDSFLVKVSFSSAHPFCLVTVQSHSPAQYAVALFSKIFMRA